MDKTIFETDEINKLAIKNFGKFVKVIQDLLTNKNIKFDLIVAAGDSGVSLLKVVEIIYEELNLPLPNTIQIPVLRFKTEKIYWKNSDVFYFENNHLLPEVVSQLKDIQKIQNILFVDDEISSKASTFLTCLKLITEVLGKRKIIPLNCFIVAEDHEFIVKDFDPNIKVSFYPFSKGTKDIYSVVSYIVPWEIENQIQQNFTEEELNSKRRLNVLLGLPTKEIFGDRAEYSDKYNTLAIDKIQNFKDLQEQFLVYLKGLISKNLA